MKASRREGKTGRKGKTSPNLPVISAPPPSIITLLTDYGTADYFVGALKGVILSINPQVQLADITHAIPPQDIEAAAFTLLASYPSFPPNTVHVAVVDPGVGSARRPLLVAAANQFFVGPDNGIFSYIFDAETRHQSFHITNERYFLRPVSPTFHGRDVFAPVAAMLSAGVEPVVFGPQIIDEVRLDALKPEPLTGGNVKCKIIHIDRFGNCITNITSSVLSAEMEGRAKLLVQGKIITSFRRFFSEEEGTGEKLFAIWGSAGFLEIAARNRSAAEMLGVARGDTVVLTT